MPGRDRSCAVARACSQSKATTRKFGLATATATSSSGIPISCSRASTSDRFTALIEAFGRRKGSKLVNGSPPNRAMTADASTTISASFTRRLVTAFVDPLLHQIPPLVQVSPYDGLRFLDRLPPGPQPYFAFPDRAL